MSRFQIKPVFPEEDRKDGSIPELNVRAIGSTSKQIDNVRQISVLSDGRKKYLTGLKPDDILMSRVLTQQEKDIYVKQLELDLEVLNKRYRPEEYEDTNGYFWNGLEKGKIVLDSSVADKIFDTDAHPDYIFMKYAILAGSYDVVGPSYDVARTLSMPYYMTTLEIENEKKMAPISDKLKASSELYQFIEKNNEESLLLFAWAMNVDKLKGFTYSNSSAVIAEQLVDYLEGRLVKGVAKKKCVENILSLLEEWKVDSRAVQIKAAVIGSHYYSNIFYDKGFFFTSERRTKLGSTIEDSIAILADPVNREELLDLKDKFKAELRK